MHAPVLQRTAFWFRFQGPKALRAMVFLKKGFSRALCRAAVKGVILALWSFLASDSLRSITERGRLWKRRLWKMGAIPPTFTTI